VLLVAPLLFFVFAGEELALLYGVLALMAALLLRLLGRLRSIEFLVTGVAAAMFAATGACCFTYLAHGRRWSTIFVKA
jgi:hypothetical protein